MSKLISFKEIEPKHECFKESLNPKSSMQFSSGNESKSEWKKVEMESFFKVKNELFDAIKTFDFSLVQIDYEENLNKKFKKILDSEQENVEFDQIVGLIESKKRKNSTSQNTSNKKYFKKSLV